MPARETIHREWVDFVLWTSAPDRVNSYAQRLTVSGAVDLAGPHRSTRPDEVRAHGARITWAFLNRTTDDEFEAMSIGDFGSVTVWTKRRVWCIRREGSMEKLVFLPRHPPA